MDGRAAGMWRAARSGIVETKRSRPFTPGEQRALAAAVARFERFDER